MICCFQGWRTCAQLQYVNASENDMAPYFPLTGPTKIALYVDKTDKTMQGYKLEWKIVDNNVVTLRCVFPVPLISYVLADSAIDPEMANISRFKVCLM